MRITAMPDLSQRSKFRPFAPIAAKQKSSSLPKNDVVYQRNAILTFKKPMKIGKQQLLQMLTKKNTVLQGTFALQNNKILLITETKQGQQLPQPASFRKKYMKTNFKKKQNQNMSENTIKKQIKTVHEKRQPINIDLLRKYFAKNHLFTNASDTSRQVKYLKGLKLIMNGSVQSEAETKDGQSWRQQRLEKRNRSIQFVNNFMRTRYKTIHSDKEVYQTQRQNQNTYSMLNFGRHSHLRNQALFEPWQRKEEYEQFQL